MRLLVAILFIATITCDAFADSARITARVGANMRSTPNGRLISALSVGTQVEVLSDSTSDWYHVRTSSGAEGWIYYRGFGRRYSASNDDSPAESETADDDSTDSDPPADSGGDDDSVTNASLPSEVLYTMYRYEAAGFGACIPALRETANAVLERNGIDHDVGNPTDAEINALGKAIAQVERLLGRPIPQAWRTQFNYINASGKWSQTGNGINVRRPAGSAKGQNVARLMHEFGHKVGNTGEYQLYKRYVSNEKCPITGYARKSWNEQFSEVFSAYVTFPDLLKARCPKAFEFFSTRTFPGSEDRVATCQVRAPEVARTPEPSMIQIFDLEGITR